MLWLRHPSGLRGLDASKPGTGDMAPGEADHRRLAVPRQCPHRRDLANLGFDWLCIDLQHGLLDYKDLTGMLPAISTTDATPLVRVP